MQRCLTLLLAASLFLLSISECRADLERGHDFYTRVINGRKLKEGNMNYIVSIRGDDPNKAMSTSCGGTLIHAKWVLTASHCFIAKTSDGNNFLDPKLWTVQAGSVKVNLHWKNGGGVWQKIITKILGKEESHAVRVGVKRIIQHPHYNEQNLEWDIALMELEKPLDLGKVDTAFVPPVTNHYKNWPRPGQKCYLAGWGCTKAGGAAVEEANIAMLKVLPNKRCSSIYGYSAGLNPEHEFCAGFHNEHIGICPGDSGSGLFCKMSNKWVVVGVASATHRNKPGEYPGLFTRVAYFRKWIEDVIFHGY